VLAGPAIAAESPPAYDGQQWEYRIEPILADSVEGIPGLVANVVLSQNDSLHLSDLGKQGWELVSVAGGRAYFKRPLPARRRGWWPFW